MSVLVDKNTRVVIQGLGSAGKFHTTTMVEYGTQVVAAAHPGRGGTEWEGIPVFNTVSEAVAETGADTSCIFVPAPGAADAILEAAAAGIRLAVCITEGIPTLDMLKVKHALRGTQTTLIGPNCPGIITPGQTKVGIMPAPVHKPGRVYEPNAELATVYAEGFEIYRQMYPALTKLHNGLFDRTVS